jgi:hypothetical protein
MHGPINVKPPNNISKWQMGFNLAFKGLIMLMALTRVSNIAIHRFASTLAPHYPVPQLNPLHSPLSTLLTLLYTTHTDSP